MTTFDMERTAALCNAAPMGGGVVNTGSAVTAGYAGAVGFMSAVAAGTAIGGTGIAGFGEKPWTTSNDRQLKHGTTTRPLGRLST